jgi:hypothetical protein
MVSAITELGEPSSREPTEESCVVTSPRIRAEVNTNAATPAAQAEHACAVVAVLGALEDRLVAAAVSAGDDRREGNDRFRPRTDRRALIGLIDEVARAERRSDLDPALIAELVTLELAGDLPFVLRIAARGRPRWVLALHDERGRERCRTLDLVRATHRRLGGAPRHPSARGRRPAAG